MREPHDLDWASARRRRWSASRIVAALALHALVLGGLVLAIDRVRMPSRGVDRATTLVTVALRLAPPPPPHPLPPPRAATPPHAPATPRVTPAPVRPRDDAAQAITLPSPPPQAAAAASAPDLSFLDNAATRQAIRDAARGATLASRGDAITNTRQTAGERLAQGVDAAHKGDCRKGEYLGGGMGLLSAPFLLAAEAMGNCSSK